MITPTRFVFSLLIVLVLSACSSGGSSSPTTPAGPTLIAGAEFGVNTYTAGLQYAPQSAMNKDGSFVITWISSGQDGDGFGVYAQRYDSAGVAQGLEFRVNSTTADNQGTPRIAISDDGAFVVAWSDLDLDNVYAQRFDSIGEPQGGEFRVNSTTLNDQRLGGIAMDSAGNFVVSWTSDEQDGDTGGVYAQRFTATGVALGAEFLVNTHTSGVQDRSRMAMNDSGEFVVTWASSGQDTPDGYGIYAQRFNSAGVAQGAELQVNSTTAQDQLDPAVAIDTQGNFVVTWYSNWQDGDNSGVYAQRYNNNGVRQGAEFQVNTHTMAAQRKPSIAMDAAGNFIVTWESDKQDGDSRGVYGQRYNAQGVAQGEEFLINTHTPSRQAGASVAMDANGHFVVSWHSDGQDTADNYGIFAKHYSYN